VRRHPLDTELLDAALTIATDDVASFVEAHLRAGCRLCRLKMLRIERQEPLDKRVEPR
jgi:hypothetical protein